MMNQFILCLVLALTQVCEATLPAANKAAESAFLQAVGTNDLDGASKCLVDGAAVDARNDQGRTALILAAQAGNLEMTRLLVEHGADVNARTTTDTGSTVLCFAVEGRNFQLLQYLIAHGAQVDGKGKLGQTPLHYAAAHGQNDVLDLLLEKGADPNSFGMPDTQGKLTTPLMAAAANGHIDTMRLLIVKGAALETANDAGDTVLMDACKRPYPEIVKLLIEKGAKVNASGRHGYTALIYAASQGRSETIKLLLAAGADPLATITEDKSPTATEARYDAADLAEQNGHLESLLLVLQAQKQALRARRANQWDLLI